MCQPRQPCQPYQPNQIIFVAFETIFFAYFYYCPTSHNPEYFSLGHRMTGLVLESHLAIPGCSLQVRFDFSQVSEFFFQDSGNYTCSLPEPRTDEGEDTITVHVITGLFNFSLTCCLKMLFFDDRPSN